MRLYSLKLHTIQLVFIFLYILATFGLMADSYSYPKSFEKLFIIDSSLSLLLLIFWALWVKLNDAIRPPQFIYKLNTFGLFPATLILAIGLSTLDYFTQPGYAKGLTNINFQKVALLMIETGLFALIFARLDWLKRNWHTLILITPLILFGLGIMIHTWPGGLFFRLVKEDGPFEYTQFLAIFIASILFLVSSFNYFKSQKLLYFGVALLLGLGFFFVAGEEISWGQRILQVKSPEFFIANNSQHEITLHNLKEFDNFTSLAYMTLGILGSIMWMVKGFAKKYLPSVIIDLIPPKEFFFFYFIVFLYNDYIRTNLSRQHNLSEWAEFVELLLYIGIAIQAYLWYSKSRSVRRKFISSRSSLER